MKKRALRKDFQMEIRRSLGRFLSIFFIVAMGVAFFSGIRASEPDMRYSADSYIDRKQLMDIRVIGTLGLTDKDVVALEKIKGVKKVEPGYSADIMVESQGNKKVLHAASILDTMNQYTLADGKMPEKSGECIIDQDFLAHSEYKIGDKITLLSGTKDPISDTFKKSTFTITGSVSSSTYLTYERGSSMIGDGEVNGFLALLPEDFAYDVYTECYLKVDGAEDLTAFTDAYDKKIASVFKRVEGIAHSREKQRVYDIRLEAVKKLADAKQQLADGKKEAYKKLADAKKELDDGEKQLADGKQKLADARNELQNGRAELKNGKAEIYKNQEKLDNSRAQIADGWTKLNAGKEELAQKEAEFQKQYDDGMAQIADGEAQLQEGKNTINAERAKIEESKARVAAMQENLAKIEEALKDLDLTEEQRLFLEQQKVWVERFFDAMLEQINDGEAQIQEAEATLLSKEQELIDAKSQLESGKTAIEQAKNELTASEQELIDGEQQADDGQMQINNAWADIRLAERKLADGEAEIATGEAEIAENEAKLADGWKEYEDGKRKAEQEIRDGEKKIRDAKREIKKIENAKWYVDDRSVISGYSGYGDNADRMGAIGKVFPLLFFIVAALISLTTMTRMVEEQRTQIGTLKALGYSKFSIAWKYLSYALLATVSGSILGVAVGEKIFPYIIVTAYKIMYIHIPDVLVPYDWHYAVMATGAAVLCTSSATLLACYKELASQPAVLMRPPTPKQGKRVFLERITFIWKRLNFTWKSTIRNLIRYKKRFFMTVFGIGGCMALMIVGFGIRDSIFDVGVIQYQELQLYDGMIILDTDVAKEEQNDLKSYLQNEKEISLTSEGYLKRTDIKKGKDTAEVYLYVPEDLKKSNEFLVFRDRTTHEEYKLGEQDVILTEKIAKALDIKKGDTISLKNHKGKFKELTVTNICENYMDHYIYVSPQIYKELSTEPLKNNNIFFKMKDFDEKRLNKIGENILEKDAALTVSYTYKIEGQLDDMLESLDIIIVVLIISAGLLAFVVLYNLNNINITERKRELATIKVLGFYDNEVSAYVYRENILLTIIGAAAGIFLGSFLHRFIIVTVEIDNVMFTRNIALISFVYSTLLTFSFSIFVNFVMYFKLKKIDMVESLKSVE